MKKLLLLGLLAAISSMAMGQATLKVKRIKESTTIGPISSSIAVDYPVSTSSSLNSRIQKFIISIMDVDECLGWSAESSKPRIQVKDMATCRKYMKAYTKNIASHGTKAEANGDLGDGGASQEMTIKLKSQGTKYVSYEMYNEEAGNLSVYSSTFYYIVKKSNGKAVSQVFKSNYSDEAFSLIRKNLPDEETRKDFDELAPKDIVNEAQCYWLDKHYLHFYYQANRTSVFDVKIPLSQAKPYLTDELKALL